MNRTTVTFLFAGLLLATAVLTVQIDTHVRAMFGDNAPAVQFLDQPEGRTITIVLRAKEAGQTEVLARELADVLSSDPMVQEVLSPVSDFTELADFLWQYRYALAPPEVTAWEVTAMAEELSRAREALTGLGSGELAARFLLDPAGSFRRLIEQLGEEGLEPMIKDPTASVVVLRAAQGPFDVTAQTGFDERIHAWAQARGVAALVLGPRPISARVSGHIAGRSVWAAGAGTVLLLGWLAWAFKSVRAVGFALLPLAMGFAAAALTVQLVFGSVHVLAFGFGGALLGLALDYPIHLLSHAGVARRHAVRCVRLGAATTAVAFGALVAAGPSALAQVGVFVAAGLVVSASVTLWLADKMPRLGSPHFLQVSGFRLPGRAWVGCGLLAASLCGILLLPERPAETLAPPPADVLADLVKLRQILDLPSGRHAIEVTGADLPDVLDAQVRLAKTLEDLTKTGAISHSVMLTDLGPKRAETPVLLSAEQLMALLPDALSTAGLNPVFSERIVRAHSNGVQLARSIPDQIPSSASALVQVGSGALSAPVRLWDVSNAGALQNAVADLADPRIRVIDRQAWVMEGIATIRRDTIRALGFGLVGAIAVLVLTTGWAAPAIVIGTAAATGLAGFAAGALFGGLGVFQIMALVLVMGIGIDYGLLAAADHDRDISKGSPGRSFGSILLCAGSTVLAFGTMALSGVSVLTEIGTTVVFGVLAMVFMVLWRAEGSA